MIQNELNPVSPGFSGQAPDGLDFFEPDVLEQDQDGRDSLSPGVFVPPMDGEGFLRADCFRALSRCAFFLSDEKVRVIEFFLPSPFHSGCFPPVVWMASKAVQVQSRIPLPAARSRR